jgi:hypothetical protein
VGPERVLEGGPEDAALDARRARNVVDLEHLVETAEVDADRACALDAAHDR